MEPLPYKLKKILRILEPYLKLKNVYDLIIYKPGEIWLDRLDGNKERVLDDRLTENSLHRLGAYLAEYHNKKFSYESPSIDVGIPEYNAKFHIIQPPAVNNIVLSIRCNHQKRKKLDSFFEKSFESNQNLNRLLEIVVTRKNFLVVGNRGSTKTTFLTNLFNAVARHEKIVTIEKKKEFTIKLPRIHSIILDNSNKTPIEAIKEAMEATAHRIVYDNIRDDAIRPFLFALTQGYTGCASVYSHTAEGAYELLAQNLVDIDNKAYNKALNLVKELFPIIIFLEKKQGKVKAKFLELKSVSGAKKRNQLPKLETLIEYYEENKKNNNNMGLSNSESELLDFFVKGYTITDVSRVRNFPYKAVRWEMDNILQKFQFLPGIPPKN